MKKPKRICVALKLSGDQGHGKAKETISMPVGLLGSMDNQLAAVTTDIMITIKANIKTLPYANHYVSEEKAFGIRQTLV